MIVQSQLFQIVVSDGTGIKQVDVDSGRQSLQQQVNQFLSGILPSRVLAVDYDGFMITPSSIMLTAEVTYRG